MPSFLDRPGLTLHCEDEGQGPALLAVHGWSLSGRWLLDALPPALLAGRRALAPDLRGHGRSQAGAPFTLAELASDLVAAFDALALERAVLLGWSLGAQAALAALPRLRGRIAGLALVSATPRFTEGEGWPHGLPARTLAALARHVERDPARAAARFHEGMFVPGELDAGAAARAAALRARTPLPSPAALRAGLDVLAAADLRGALGALDVPVAVVHGERDPVCLPGAGRALAGALPGAHLAVIPGAGHAPFLSRPDAFAAALAPLLAACA
ncbi:alpha/beta fold hydrolase [Anaeromyxobacter sp. SG17]|uniref:alpha/beta fold hydrolase n=2 Tax=unclassified Anaeromyxobacter TaxID=2620896 RepID=UPI001F568009|nr:alpha/beta fold hydrolase [Anaeromyxobacter sp. SG17]